jgi:ferredoxin
MEGLSNMSLWSAHRLPVVKDRAMIKINVDMYKCQNYAQCVFEAPNVFDLDDDDKLVYHATADDSEQDNVQRAIDSCPMQAIAFGV